MDVCLFADGKLFPRGILFFKIVQIVRILMGKIIKPFIKKEIKHKMKTKTEKDKFPLKN